MREGILLAQEQASKNSRAKVDVIVRGRVGQWGADAAEAARMVTDEEVAGLIAPPDGAASHLVLQVSGRTAVPVASLCADSSVTRTGVPWMLRVVPTTEQEATALFESALLRKAGKRAHWAAVVPDGRAGREISRDLAQAASAVSCELDPIVEVSSSSSNPDAIRGPVLRTQPDGVLIWLAAAPAASVVKDFRSSGYTGKLAGPGRLNSGGIHLLLRQTVGGLHCSHGGTTGRVHEALERISRFVPGALGP